MRTLGCKSAVLAPLMALGLVGVLATAALAQTPAGVAPTLIPLSGQILTAGQPRVGQGDAVPHAGRTQRLALLQTIDRRRAAQPVGLRRDFAQLLKQPLLGGELPDHPNGAWHK